jgi:hypothetical protein
MCFSLATSIQLQNSKNFPKMRPFTINTHSHQHTTSLSSYPFKKPANFPSLQTILPEAPKTSSNSQNFHCKNSDSWESGDSGDSGRVVTSDDSAESDSGDNGARQWK